MSHLSKSLISKSLILFLSLFISLACSSSGDKSSESSNNKASDSEDNNEDSSSEKTKDIEPIDNNLKLTANSKGLFDQEGRFVMLRGINARIRGIFDVGFDDGRTELHPVAPFAEEDCRRLGEDLGLNLLRLCVNWSGIEPEEGKYNEAYIKQVFDTVDFCHKHGVYSLVDFHQDGYSKEIGQDGAPLWAIVPAPEKLLEGPLNNLGERITSKQVLAAFASFFENKENLQDKYIKMANHVMSYFKDHPGAIGLEIINEPTAKSQKILDVFYKKFTGEVREQYPDVTIFFEPVATRNFFDFAVVKGEYPYGNAVYSPHIYTRIFQGDWESGDRDSIDKSIKKAVEEAEKYNTAMMITEFGHAPYSTKGKEWLGYAFENFDKYKLSWAFWLYEEWDSGKWGLFESEESGRTEFREEFGKFFGRPFPERLAGDLDKMSWDQNSKKLEIEISNASALLHRITVPKINYPNGIELYCDEQKIEHEIKSGRVDFSCKGKRLILQPSLP